MLRSFVLASATLIAFGAAAADLGVKKPSAPAPVSAACKETKALPADAFGFATGSDVADLGAWGLGLDTVGTAGLRGGDARSIAPVLQLSGSFFPCLEVGPYVQFGYASFKPYGGGATVDTTSLGGGIEMKYKLLGRAPHGLGLTLAFTPSVVSSDSSPGISTTIYGTSFRLLTDAELIKGRLYGAFNAEFLQNWVDGGGTTVRASFFNIRGALTTPVTDALYLGAEVSYQSAYVGNWLNNYAAHAVYVGPTFFWQINDKFSLNGTWAYQVAGDGPLAGRSLGIDAFARHQGRLKLAYAF